MARRWNHWIQVMNHLLHYHLKAIAGEPRCHNAAETREEPIFRHVRPSEKQTAKPTLQDFNAGKSTAASQHVLMCHKENRPFSSGTDTERWERRRRNMEITG